MNILRNMRLLIKNALLDNTLQQILIENDCIKAVAPSIAEESDETLDAEGKAVIPSFVNAHTHAAMTLLRGYADDMFLQEWLEKKIWPLEQRLTEDDIYHGTRLACLEMIKSGTTLFNDMYWHCHGAARAVKQMGIRGIIGAVVFDGGRAESGRIHFRETEELIRESASFGPMVTFSLGPHAIYTVSEESLRWCSSFSAAHGLLITLHLSETEKEVNDCLEQHGLRPVEYLEKIGFLSPRVVLAHCVWLNDREIEIIKAHDVKVVHNPTSNMKLAVGSAMPYRKLRDKGVTIAMGTDGCSSNNNLDMLESMKFACLLQKYHCNDSSVLSAAESFEMATLGGASALGIAMGRIAPGRQADLLLVDQERPDMTPCHNLISNLVYSGNGSCIDTVICAGKIVMQGRKVEGEEEIIARAREAVKRFR